jgi:hypothetical protein
VRESHVRESHVRASALDNEPKMYLMTKN